ncbi:hypothetical protein [Beduinella massiliensis]|uniref:hypothetical protein n=1 Tax=Beduinella massiliensis TaxID=1852363 RepID=UPI000C8167E5
MGKDAKQKEARSKEQEAAAKQRRWALFITGISFVLSFSITFVSEVFMRSMGLGVALIALFVLIGLGIAADIVGTAITAAEEKPFVAMAAKRIAGAKQSIWLIRRADRISNILNDVVGDITSIVSGAAGSAIVYYLMEFGISNTLGTMLMSATTAALIIGGKALGKHFALSRSHDVIAFVGRTIAAFSFRRRGKG